MEGLDFQAIFLGLNCIRVQIMPTPASYLSYGSMALEGGVGEQKIAVNFTREKGKK